MPRWMSALVWLSVIIWPMKAWAFLPAEFYGVEAQWTAGFKSVVPLDSHRLSNDGMVTNEARLKGNLSYSAEGFFVYGTPEIRVNDAFSSHMPGGEQHYSREGLALSRNLTLSSSWVEISFRELYMERETELGRWRAGNQVYAWGTADLMNPTAWFNPQDLRELFLKEEDAITRGVPSLSLLCFLDDLAVEAVVMPVSISRLQAEDGDFFHVLPDNFALPIEVTKNEPAPVTVGNMGVGIKGSRSIGPCDISMSAYRGPDREPLIVPVRISTVPGEPLSVVVDASHHVISAVGGDLSANLGGVVVQVEAAWTFDKRGYVDQGTTDPSAIIFPYPVKRSGYWDISAGLNWFVPSINWFPDHEGETVVTLEGHGSGFDGNELGDPLYSRTVALRFQDTYYGNRIPVSLSWVRDVNMDGEVVWAKIGYDFMNGLLMEGALFFFDGDAPGQNRVGSPFWYLRQRDLFMISVTCTF